MRYGLTIAVCLLTLSTSGPTKAQSEDWSIDPSIRDGLTTREQTPLFGPYMDGDGEGILNHLQLQLEAERDEHMGAGHWYEEDCCSQKDCKPYATNHVIQNIDGSISVYFAMRWILVDKALIKQRPNKAPYDELWHVCISVDMTDEPYPVCAYPPDVPNS